MRLLRLFVFLALALCLHVPCVLAQSISSMEQRQSWQESQVLVRAAMKIELASTASKPSHTFWLFIERTPNGRMRMITKDTMDGPTKLTFLVQGNVCLALAGGDVGSPAAPWMLGHYLVGQSLEPSMLLAWVMGVPGRDFQVDAQKATVMQESGKASHIEQAGWKVSYDTWTQAKTGEPSVPATFDISRSGISMQVALAKIETYLTVPEGYSEFKIM